VFTRFEIDGPERKAQTMDTIFTADLVESISDHSNRETWVVAEAISDAVERLNVTILDSDWESGMEVSTEDSLRIVAAVNEWLAANPAA
jgi:hypothetical protein